MKLTKILGYLSVTLIAMLANQAVASDESITKALAGKTISNGSAEFKLQGNGRLTGKAGAKGEIVFKGAWAIRDERWCRTFSEPERFAGTECQTLVLGDGAVTITGANGPQVWQIK